MNPHLHAVFLDGVYAPDRDSMGQMFHPAPPPTQQEIEAVVCRASKRILRLLQRHGVITLVTAPGDGEVNVDPGDHDEVAMGWAAPRARIAAFATQISRSAPHCGASPPYASVPGRAEQGGLRP